MNSDRLLRGSVVLAAALICILCATSASKAENKAGATTVSIFGGGYTFDHDLLIDKGWTAGLGLGYNMTENWGIELVGNYIDSKFDKDAVLPGTDRDLRAYLYRLDLLYHFQPSSWFVPYLAAGAGGMTYDAQAQGAHTDNNFVADYGAGLKMFVTPAVAIRGDVRNIHSFQDDETRYSDILYTLGLTFAFGGKEEMKEEVKEEVKEVVVAPVAPLDSDNDGVTDDLDKCPGTPSGVKVDKDGCPLD
ncbi:MAG: outer membrane beta-barrel domain-containing protein, partial [Deltaproteobacteria bacterium]|nr:outer membrane beta-barrel domain-containing protein [Deltaproteobacteria bacterium]